MPATSYNLRDLIAEIRWHLVIRVIAAVGVVPRGRDISCEPRLSLHRKIAKHFVVNGQQFLFGGLGKIDWHCFLLK